MSIQKKYYGSFVVASLVYIIGTLIGPLSPNRFNLTPSKTHFLQLTIALPIVLIWAVAIYGAARFKIYTNKIKQHKDGMALNQIAIGLTILVASLMANGVFSVLRAWAFKNGWLPTYTILSNYLAVLLPLAAFIYMYLGSTKLKKLARNKDASSGSAWLISGLVIVVVAAVYIKALYSYQYRTATPDPSRYSSFYMSDLLILLTLILPYLISWWLGIKACLNIWSYQRDVKGLIYRQSLMRLVVGVLVAVSFSVILQLLVASSTLIAKAGLGSILIILYLLILLYALSYLIIASGARRLDAIEKVQ
jgi:hypothetical protein